MILKEVEISELGDMIRGIVKDELGNITPPPREKRRELIRRKEARALLGGISDPTIISYEKKGFINPVRIGGTILYDRDEILQKAKG